MKFREMMVENRARFTAEFVLIVVSVLAALAVDGWASDRAERRALAYHMGRISEALAADSALVSRWSSVARLKHEHVSALLADLDGTSSGVTRAAQLIGLQSATSSARPNIYREAAYRELLVSGVAHHLDPVIRAELGRFYSLAAESQLRLDALDWSSGPLTGVVPARMARHLTERLMEVGWSLSNEVRSVADSLWMSATDGELARLSSWRTRPDVELFLASREDAESLLARELLEVEAALSAARGALVR